MTPDLFSDRSESNRPTITRRRAVAMLAGASATGLGALAVGSEEAAAEITLEELAVADGTYSAADPEPTPVVDLEARVSYRVGSITEWNIGLEFGPPGDVDFISVLNESTNATEAEQTRTLSAPLTDADAFDSDDFAPDAETSVEHDVEVVLTFSVMDGSETLVQTSVSDTATVVIENETIDIDGSIGGTGEIRFEE